MSSSRLEPSLRASEATPHKAELVLCSEYVPQLITPSHEDWVSFDASEAPHYFTPTEMKSLPDQPGQTYQCAKQEIPLHCCLGAFSLAGIQSWDDRACPHANYFKFMAPHKGESFLGPLV